MSHFVSMLLFAVTLTLSLCFRLAWRLSAGNDVDVTATIHIWNTVEAERSRPLLSPSGCGSCERTSISLDYRTTEYLMRLAISGGGFTINGGSRIQFA
ncbi:hypothetical protein [Bradyrhizobium guangdongense]